MALFLADLDNTLIYSYKRDIGLKKVLVEQKEGKELSFMTQKAVELLSNMSKRLTLIPLTTRSLEQYKRINFPPEIAPSIALAANGGILIINGNIDIQWYEQSMEAATAARTQMQYGIKILNVDSEIYHSIGYVDDLFVYTKSHNPTLTMHNLAQRLDLKQVSIHENGDKIYILPKTLDKGMALKRIRERFKNETIISAGDSLFDIPMLAMADIGFYPQAMQKLWETQKHQCHAGLHMIGDSVFSDGLLVRLGDMEF